MPRRSKAKSLYHYILEALMTVIVLFLMLQVLVVDLVNNRFLRQVSKRASFQPAALFSPLCCWGHGFPGLERLLGGPGIAKQAGGLG